MNEAAVEIGLDEQVDDSHFFQVHLELFEGPIDLLLHLVKRNELPIEKVSLAKITDQYLACLDTMRGFDLEIAGEYLVIAATLLSIKSSIVLNEPVQLVIDEEGNLVNPHDELLRRLREAAIYKDGAQELGLKNYLGIDVFAPHSILHKIESIEAGYVDHDPLLLGKAFRKLLGRAEIASELIVQIDSVSIVEKMKDVIRSLQQAGGEVVFHSLVPDLMNRASILGTFIALLELCKRQIISVRQDILGGEGSDEIFICLASTGVNVDELASEFDMQTDGETNLAVNG